MVFLQRRNKVKADSSGIFFGPLSQIHWHEISSLALAPDLDCEKSDYQL